ncbi:DUF1697 domain-containing protein [Desertimonas flava]|uniref:DUF1697 domain-containing protein n=1 Tax=Desertimonas flava TaxID=2064846 RepID=UPI000E340916|nr:DUF1697 domain-containing protein [Desertimonas flava]
MSVRVAFIRGINVGGRHKVPMAALRADLEAVGFGDVRTYIQSGNVVYRTRDQGTPADDAAAIAKTIRRAHGFAPAVMAFEAADVAAHLDASPYRDADPSQAFLVFVDGDPAELGDPTPYATDGEQWQVGPGVVHLYTPNGLGRSKLGGRYAGASKVATTTRNLGTIAAVLALADGL